MQISEERFSPQKNLSKTAEEVWDSLEQSLIGGLIESIPQRIAAVEATGWYTQLTDSGP